MNGWLVVGVVLYLAYALAYVANHPGGEVKGFRALTLFPLAVPIMLFWWVIGKAHWYRDHDSREFTVGIRSRE